MDTTDRVCWISYRKCLYIIVWPSVIKTKSYKHCSNTAVNPHYQACPFLML